MSYLSSYLFPWLVTLAVLRMLVPPVWKQRRPRVQLLGFGCLSAGLMVLPLQGLPLGRWFAALNFSPSIPLLVVLVNRLTQSFFDKEFLRPRERLTGWLFGIVAGALLYPCAMGLGNLDPYELGWGFSGLFAIVALITICLIWERNRFGIVLLGSIVAFDVNCFDSQNFWDYLVDPVYCLASAIALATMGFKQLRPGTINRSLPQACSKSP